MSIERPILPNNGPSPTRNPITGIILAGLIALIAGFAIGKYFQTSNAEQGFPLWNNQFVEAVVVNLANPSDKKGLLAVNITKDIEQDRFICIYEHDNAGRKLGSKVFVRATSINGIPVVSELRDELGDGSLFDGEIRTNINEHNSFAHGSRQGIHRKAHIKPMTTGVTSGFSVMKLEDIISTISATHSLYSKAQAIYNASQADSEDKVAVFIDLDVNKQVISLDTCHFHNGINQGCVND